jgi:hypothetical protein
MLIREVDDPIYRGEGGAQKLNEIESVLDERETRVLDMARAYVEEARSEGLDPAEAYRRGWTPGQSESHSQSKGQGSKGQGQSKGQSQGGGQGKDKDQDQSKDQGKGQSQGGQRWGGGRGR